MITARACGLFTKFVIILSKSSGLEFRKIFSETATQMPRLAAIDMNDAIPWK